MKRSILEFYSKNPQLYPTDKETEHTYISMLYDRLLMDLPEDASVLEIGVREGWSIKLWSEFFPKGTVLGLDIVDVLHIPKEGENYKIRFGDAFTYEMLASIDGEFDLIIEDGPHTAKTQFFALSNYVRLLKPGGVLVVEDIQDMQTARYLADFFSGTKIIDLRFIKGRYDDIALVLRK